MKPRRRTILLGFAFVALALVLLFAATYRPALPDGRLVLLFTRDVRGHVLPCGCYPGQPGGLARIPAAVPEDFGASPTLLLDAGGFIGNPRLAGFDDPDRPLLLLPAKAAYLRNKHEAQLAVMDRLGYDAFGVASGDFALGQAYLLEAHQRLDSRFTCANIVHVQPGGTGRTVFPPFRLLRAGRGSTAGIPFGGVRVGVFSLVSEKTALPRLPEDVYVLAVTDPVLAARDILLAMRKAGAELTVLLFHGSPVEARQVIRRAPGIDICLAQAPAGDTSASAHRIESTQLVLMPPGGTVVGRLDLVLDDTGIRSSAFEGVLLHPDLPLDRDALEPYRVFQRALAADPPRPAVLPPPDQPYAGSPACAACHDDPPNAPWRQWQGTAHARAMDTLRERNHEGDPECRQCHATGYGEATGFDAPGAPSGLDAVGCETCHGPRGTHAAEWTRRKEAGQTLPEPQPGPPIPGALCLENCHKENRDPGFGRNAEKRYEKIRH